MKLKRIINQNNKLILIIIVLVIFFLFIIRVLNSYYEKQEKEKIANNNTAESSINKKNDSIDTYQEIKKDEDQYIKVIDRFINYCNNNQISQAYNMLTDECKEEMFQTEESFSNFYFPIFFSEKRTYSTLKWYSEENKATYQVTLFSADMLATGNVSELNDYYTVIKNEDGTYGLNINKYIYGEDRNKTYNNEYLIIQIGHVDKYLDYEEYEIKITNRTSKKICLSSDKYKNSIYLENSAETTYSSINSIISKGEETLETGETKSYNIKFNKKYDPTNNVKTLVFKDVLLNYEEYLNTENKNSYTNRTSIKIDF